MPAEPGSDLKFEIGHVLFIDIVGYSRLPMHGQIEQLQQLKELVRGTEQFCLAEAEGKLLRLPTGDGGALVFRNTQEAPVLCALEISKALKSHPELRVRMGIHSGPVNEVADLNEQMNVAGAGINIAQRVMDCGDAGHILLSKRVAEDLEQYRQWQPYLHDLGECEVKHGAHVHLFNLYKDELGNPQLPEAILRQRLEQAVTTVPSQKTPLLRRFVPIGAILIAIVLAVGLWLVSHQNSENPARIPASISSQPAARRVAVLPFKPLMPGNQDQVLEMGMADSLITKFSNSSKIIVPSLSSVRKYADSDKDALTAGRELQVNSVVEGNVQKSGDHIRVTARLINVADGSSLWAETFDEKFTDVFAVEDAISQRVADALALRLTAKEKQRLTEHYTENTEAYQLYIKGRFYWNKYTEEGLRKSIEYFKQAVEKDPNYALAYSGIADSYSLLADLSFAPPKEDFEQGRSYAQKALALDETLASAHLSLGIVKLFYDWDFTEAAKQLRRAKDLDPNNAQIYHFYGHYLELVGRADEGVQETKRGVELDPTNLIVNSEVGYGYYLARQPDLAIDQMRKTLDLDSTFSYASYVMASAYEQTKKYQAAITELNRARPISGDWSWIVGELGYVYALLGNRVEAEKTINELNSRETREYVDPVLVAYIYIALGDKDRAFASLDKAYRQRSGLICFLQVEPKFDLLRSDPRFQDLERRMGLVQLTTMSTQSH
jgi:TolB-like protein/class 3 adenylate cyclase/Flp pilus assembly protein TadD